MSSIEHLDRAPQPATEEAHGAQLHNFVSELWRPAAQWVQRNGAKIAPKAKSTKK